MYFNGGTMTANFAGLAVPPLRVAVTQNEDGTYNADHTLTQIRDAYDNGNAVYCQYGNMVLSLEMISKAFCSFACVQSGNVHTVQIGLSSVTVTTTPVVKTVNGTAPDENGNVVLDITSGGGGGGSSESGVFYFFETVILDVDRDSVSLQMPVNWGRIIQFNIHADIMDNKLTAEMALQLKVGNSYTNQGSLTTGFKGLNFYGIRYMWDDFRTYFTLGRDTSTVEPEAAIPALSGSWIGPENNQDHFRLTSKTEGVMFPKGMKFSVWVVYAP